MKWDFAGEFFSDSLQGEPKMSKPEKLAMRTPSLADANFAALAALFPNVVTEAMNENGSVVRAIDKDVLAQEINARVVEGREERYQFTWPDKRKSVLLANAPIAAALRPCREKSVDFDTTENLYIEGDNLDVLKLLRETYLNRVKMIYIDPPYNTGHDFVYEDDFADATGSFLRRDGQFDEQGNRLTQKLDSNGRFHTDWLNMMYPRLRLARDLLSEDGVIFISIDENEVSNLQKLCNEAFGERNYAATFLWTRTNTPPALSCKCRKTVEYVLAYEKRRSALKYFGAPLDGGDAPLLNAGNPEKTLRFPSGSIHFPFLRDGVIPAGEKGRVWLLDELRVEDGVNANAIRLVGEFKWEQGTLEAEVRRGTCFVVKSDRFSIRFQRRNLEDAYKTPTNLLNVELNREAAVGTNETALRELEELGLGKCFDYAKPLSLVQAVARMVCAQDKEALVLDFFSGSGTTADAIMRMNAEDGGHRRFIMVQIPERTAPDTTAFKMGFKDIAELGRERIRRAGAKIKADDRLTTTGLDVGFRVLKLDSSNMKDVYYTPEQYVQMSFNLDGLADNIKEDRTDEDLLFQVMLDLGIPLSAKITQDHDVFHVNDTHLIACFKQVDSATITEIARQKPYYAVFRDSSFASDSAMVNFEQAFSTYSPNTIRRVL